MSDKFSEQIAQTVSALQIFFGINHSWLSLKCSLVYPPFFYPIEYCWRTHLFIFLSSMNLYKILCATFSQMILIILRLSNVLNENTVHRKILQSTYPLAHQYRWHPYHAKPPCRSLLLCILQTMWLCAVLAC